VSRERDIASTQIHSLTGPQTRILNALAWLESIDIVPATRAQVAFLADYKPGGAAFKNPLASLNTAGLVGYPATGMVQLHAAGRVLAEAPDLPLTTEQLQRMILDRLTGPQRRILVPLIEVYPADMGREELAAKAGYEANGAAFKNPLASLRTLGLVSYPGTGLAEATDVLFLDERRTA